MAKLVPVSTSGLEVLEVARRLACGFLSSADVAVIAADPLTRLQPLLVRCHGARFVAPADQVRHLITVVTAGGESVRDVSIPAVTR